MSQRIALTVRRTVSAILPRRVRSSLYTLKYRLRELRSLPRKTLIDLEVARNTARLSQLFADSDMRPLIEHNRATLRMVKKWIDDDVYQHSIFQYGLPERLRPVIDLELGDDLTYTDVMSYLSRFLEKPVNYLELGVSVGKNLLQMTNMLQHCSLTGFDIEEINPVLQGFFEKVGRVDTWHPQPGSMKTSASSLTEYRHAPNDNRLMYLSGDVFDENAWRRLAGNKFNVIFSDAFHSPEALLLEHQMIQKYELLDEAEFIWVWDDLSGEMPLAFLRIWSDLRQKHHLRRDDKLLVAVNGWVPNDPHPIGIITRLNRWGRRAANG